MVEFDGDYNEKFNVFYIRLILLRYRNIFIDNKESNGFASFTQEVIKVIAIKVRVVLPNFAM